MKRRIIGTLKEKVSMFGKLLLIVLVGLSAVLAAGCKEEKKGLNPLMADLDSADSAEILYFRTPDSSRYFTYLPTRDKAFLGELISNLKQDTVQPITCMKEGKIYLFKNGEIFNTVFFGYLDKECRFLRYIKNGNLFHYALSEPLQASLEKLKTDAKEPAVVERIPAEN
ncbi:MAG: hypothetical protein ABW036_04165 [Flavitalea sp.]